MPFTARRVRRKRGPRELIPGKHEIPTRLAQINGPCTLYAIKEVSAASEERLIAESLAIRDGKLSMAGLYDREWLQILKNVGCDYVTTTIKDLQAVAAKYEKRRQDRLAARGLSQTKPTGRYCYDSLGRVRRTVRIWHDRPTVAQFAREFKSGVFILQVEGHVLVCRDGHLIEMPGNRVQSRSKVRNAYRITNPAPSSFLQDEGKYVEIVRWYVRKREGAPRERWLQVCSYITQAQSQGRKVTPQELFKLGYQRSEFRRDKAKGNIKLVK
jgi:hypothetical protein